MQVQSAGSSAAMTQQQLDIAVLKKTQDAMKTEAAAMLEMLEAVSEAMPETDMVSADHIDIRA